MRDHKMRRMTFQIGSNFQAKPRVDPGFERLIENVRSAAAPVRTSVIRGPQRHPTRLEARLARLSIAA
jgi:hypothetical protein